MEVHHLIGTVRCKKVLSGTVRLSGGRSQPPTDHIITQYGFGKMSEIAVESLTVGAVGDYELTESLQFDGTMYIDTSIKPTNDTVIVAVAEYNGGYNQYLYGSRSGASSNDAFAWIVTSSRIYPQYGSMQGAVVITPTTDRVTVRQGADGAYIDDKCIQTYDTTSFTGAYSLYIGGCNTGGKIDGRTFSGKLYGLQMWQSGSLKLDLTPCQYGDSVGLYDFVSNQFFAVQTVPVTAKLTTMSEGVSI